MRGIFIAVALMMSALVGQAQTSILYPNPRVPQGFQPAYYVDSIKMDSTANVLHFINPNQIKKITIERDARHKNGAIYITLKNHKVLDSLLNDRQLSLQEILNSNVKADEQKNKALFIWDDKLITDTTNIHFPSKKITRVTVIKASEMPYFKTAFPDMLIVMVSTKPPVIYIRGAAKR